MATFYAFGKGKHEAITTPPVRRERKVALLSQNDRPYDLEYKAFQTEKALGFTA